MKIKKAFTLIELLVVIAIIAMLLAIVIPSMRKAKEYTKKILCQSNLHQVGIAIGNYESSFSFNFRGNTKWLFINGTGDMPYEGNSQPKPMRDIVATNMIPNREAFFCPGVANISYEKNYLRSGVLAGNTASYPTSWIETQMESNPAFTDKPAFWGTYCYLWKKQLYSSGGRSIASVNNASSGVLFCDISQEIWAVAMGISNDDGKLLINLKNSGNEVKQTISHCNALMQDFSVLNPADKHLELMQWLWNSDRWAGL